VPRAAAADASEGTTPRRFPDRRDSREASPRNTRPRGERRANTSSVGPRCRSCGFLEQSAELTLDIIAVLRRPGA
jgi:hypothetical protein